MFKLNKLNKNLLLAGTIMLSIQSELQATGWKYTCHKSKEEVACSCDDLENLSSACKLCINAFYHAYQSIPLEQLRLQKNLQEWLSDVFTQEEQEVREALESDNPNNIHCAIVRSAQTTIGFASFNADNEPNSIYLRQLAIHPDYQRQGVAKTLLKAIVKIYPNATKVTVVVRKVNKNGISFYNALGFKPTGYAHEGYDNRYAGFEADISKILEL